MQDLYDLNIERVILNSILFDNEKFEEVKRILTEKDFYSPFHQIVFKTIEELLNQENFIDEFILKNELEKKKIFNETEFLEIISNTPIENVEEYAKIIKELALKRKIVFLLKTSNTIIKQKDPFEIIEELKNKLDKLEKQNTTKYFNIKRPIDIKLKNNEEKFILEDFIPIPKKAVTLLSAKGGSGKSWLVLQLALRYINKHPNKKVFIWLSEDTLEDSKGRMIHILNHIFTNETSLITDLNHPVYKNLYFLGSETRPFHFIEYEYKQKKINNLFYKLKNECKYYDFIILDPLIAFYGGDENNNSQAREFMDLLNEWANKENKAILLVHHNNKSITGGIRGASAFVDAVRVQYELCKTEDKEKNQNNIDITDNGIRIVKLVKDNKGTIKYFGTEKEIKIFDFDDKLPIKRKESDHNSNNEKKSLIDLL